MIKESVSDIQLSGDLQKRAKALRNKCKRATFTDFIGLSAAMEKEIERFIENMPDDGSPVRTFSDSLETMGEVLDYVAENLERLAEEREIEQRTREEWEELERQYVARADYTFPDLVDDLLSKIERRLNIKFKDVGKVLKAHSFEVLVIDHPDAKELLAEAQAELEQYRPCAHRFCLNYFKPRRKNHIYCDEYCQQAEKDARKEFIRTSNSEKYNAGTFLPKRAYKTIREGYSEEKYKEWEIAFDLEGHEKMIQQQNEEDDAYPNEKAINRRKRKEKRDRKKIIQQGIENAKRKNGPVKEYTIGGEELERYRQMALSREVIKQFKGRPNVQYIRAEHWLSTMRKVMLIQTNDYERFRRVYHVRVMEGAKVLYEKEFFTRKDAENHYGAIKKGEFSA